jgi:hypothetical protein
MHAAEMKVAVVSQQPAGQDTLPMHGSEDLPTKLLTTLERFMKMLNDGMGRECRCWPVRFISATTGALWTRAPS